MSFDLDTLYQLLPSIHRIRDAEQGEPLKALLAVIAEQVSILEEDLAQSYNDHFIETCADWAVPYVGDLLGYRALNGNVPRIRSPRSEVANTIGYRRRKGTAVALEQLARDVTGWHAHVVEFFQRLATTQSMHHLRPDNRSPYLGGQTRNLATGNFSKIKRPLWEPLQRLNTPFDNLAHTLDVRRISLGKGRFNIPNIGIFLWRLDSYPMTDTQAFKLDDRRYSFSPLGNNIPLFTLPQTLEDFSGLSGRMNVPDPIRRRTLDTYLEEYYGDGKSLSLKYRLNKIPPGQVIVPSDDVIVCDLSDTPTGAWAHSPQQKIAIDPALGRIAFPSAEDPPTDVRVSYHYGFSKQMGGGEYDRTDSIPAGSVFRNSHVWQIGVTSRPPATPGDLVGTFGEAVAAWNAHSSNFSGATGVIVIMDGATYAGDVAEIGPIRIPAGSRLLIVAADWVSETNESERRRGQFNAFGVRPLLRGKISVSGINADGKEPGEIHLNGLTIEGWIEVVDESPNSASGQIGRCSLSHCTLVPGRGLTAQNWPSQVREPSLVVGAFAANLEINNSITGGLRVDRTVMTSIAHSIVDATSPCGVAFSALDDSKAGGTLHVENSTIIGKVRTSQMELATNTIFFARLAQHDSWPAPLICEQRQTGCIRFSYVPLGSYAPRCYLCVPATETDAARIVPHFSSLRYGTPDYAQLSQRCPSEIFNGADDKSEMGAFHDLFEPQRINNLEVRLDEYLRFGLEAGIIFAPQVERSPASTSSYGYAAPVDLCADHQERLPGVGTKLLWDSPP